MEKIAKEAVLCFVIKNNKVLMINRNKPPFTGMWNAVGGKVEENESPKDAAIREIEEEGGITVKSVELLSTFTWNYDSQIGYAFVAKVGEEADDGFIINSEEGIVCFKDIPWVINEKNYGVIEDLRVFLKDIKNGEKHDYHLVYDNSKLTEVIVKG